MNAVFHKALALAPSDASVLRDAADYFAASDQVQEAIPLYLRVLELQPNDSNAREKLATGFILTNQRGKAIEMLQEIIQQHPEKYQTYELLGRVLEEDAKALVQEKKLREAKAEYTKAAANYEQSLLINPAQPDNYVHLAELLLFNLSDDERAVRLLREARRQFPTAPQLTYLLAVALREANHAQESVATFEEALHESETEGQEISQRPLLFRIWRGRGTRRPLRQGRGAFQTIDRDSIRRTRPRLTTISALCGPIKTATSTRRRITSNARSRATRRTAPISTASAGSITARVNTNRLWRSCSTPRQELKADDPTVFEHIGDTYAMLNQSPRRWNTGRRRSRSTRLTKSWRRRSQKLKAG